MPEYILPAVKGQPEDDAIETTRDEYRYPDQWARRISIPVNTEILEALQIGGRVTVTLDGTVEEMTNNQSAGGAGRTEIVLVVSSVDAYPNDQTEEDDDFVRGFGNLRRNYGRSMS